MTAMKTLQIEILNPKAERLIDDLAEMNLIRIDQEKESPLEQYQKIGQELADYRRENNILEELFTMEEIVQAVKQVRAEMYEEKLKKNEEKSKKNA